jgi:hypothetical protein
LTSGPPANDPGFTAACRIAALRTGVTRGSEQRSFVRAPLDVVRAVRYFRSLPFIETSDATPRDWARTRLASRALGHRMGIARAVLEIPDSDEEYLRGRRKQAMRTNLRRADELGFVARVLPRADRDVLDRDLKLDGRRPLSWDEEQLIVVVNERDDPEEATRACAIASVHGDWAHLHRFIKLGARDDSLMSRYVLQLALVQSLREEGVRYVHAGSPLTAKRNVPYFQYLTGFEIVNIRVLAHGRQRAAVRRTAGAPARV